MAGRHNAQVYEELPVQRGRPWLYPYNRRLRHLHGISIRNLVLSATKSRPRGNTVDDAALPTSLRSPAKVLAQQERKQVEHSRSSTDLKAIAEAQDGALTKGKDKSATTHTSAEGDASPSAKRPTMRRLRRRSTLDWQNASSQYRQKKLEDVISSAMCDVFFSLHTHDQDDPVYISEVITRTMNPDFRFFDLNALGPAVSRLEDLVVKIWARNDTTQEYTFLVEMALNLRSLQFIGKSIEGFPQPLPQNCILFHLKDGIYTSFLDNFAGDGEAGLLPQPPPRTMSISQTLGSSSYDALMRLGTLDECIQDALATRAKLEEEINAILGANEEGISTVREAAFKKTSLQELDEAIALEKKRLALAKRRRDEARSRLAQRKAFIKEGYSSISETESSVPSLHDEIAKAKTKLASITEETLGQRRRICEDLTKIYPITPALGSQKALHFAIHDLPLSNSTFDDDTPSSAESTAAALGHVALLVHNLSFYLSTPLPYPTTWRGSTSTITDPISEVAGASRVYPLFGGRGPRFRFEFAVFLLNKDIEFLSEKVGIRVIDLRQTLPNLKYLFYVATAGKGEVPVRKAGGIRGFLRGGGGSGMSSRRESLDGQVEGEVKGLMLPPPLPVSKALNGSLNGALKKGYGNVQAGAMGKGSKLRDVG